MRRAIWNVRYGCPDVVPKVGVGRRHWQTELFQSAVEIRAQLLAGRDSIRLRENVAGPGEGGNHQAAPVSQHLFASLRPHTYGGNYKKSFLLCVKDIFEIIIQHFQENGINTVVMCGLITSVCVQHSAYGLFEAGFNVIVVKDACADRGRSRHEAALQLYEGYMYRTMTCRDI